ncbi:hypothetical protein Avbf_11274 [Armadillidium vulgare]|nr:hypothetical protein Avbf_11274 [Armadillidium vulgare]
MLCFIHCGKDYAIMFDDDDDEIKTLFGDIGLPIKIEERISYVRRICRKREKHRSKSSSLIPCPLVLQNISNQLQELKKKSLVIGTESLLKSVYRLLQLPQLKPCLQRPSEHSVSILKIDIAHCKEEVIPNVRLAFEGMALTEAAEVICTQILTKIRYQSRVI